jgi:uncharacterized peroxidase-related enzyme
MSRLHTVDPAVAQGKAKELLDAVKAKMGAVPNLTRVMANSPAVLEAYLGFSGALAGGSSLGGRLREQIALAVGQANGCEYCLAAHNFLAKRAGVDDDRRIANRLGGDPDPKTDAALKFARRVVERRGQVSDQDVAAVRDAGWSDAEIAEIVAETSLNVFTNWLNNTARTVVDFPAAPALETSAAACGTGACGH